MNCEYLLDTNIYIQAWQLQYPRPVFPGFWEWFQANHQSGRIRTIDKVVQELKESSAIHAWVKENAIQVSTSDSATTEAYKQVIKTAKSRVFPDKQKYTQQAMEEFESVADSFLIASAYVHNVTLVTWEVPNNQQKSKVHIPDITKPLCVEVITTPKLLITLNPRFTWDKTVQHE